MKKIFFIFSMFSAILCANEKNLSSSSQGLVMTNEPTVIIYEEPRLGAHIQDILRYGLPVIVTREQNEWSYIEFYESKGWVLKKQLLEVENDPRLLSNAIVGVRGAYLFDVADTEWGPFLYLPFETEIQVIKELPQAHNRWLMIKLQDGREGYVQRNQVVFNPQILTMSEMVEFSKQFLGTNFLWGGTTPFGFDCSGFVRMLYRHLGIALFRNSNQMSEDTRFAEIPIDEAQAGDLIFFKSALGRVVHVGMMINGSEFIHSFTKEATYVTVNSLQDERFHNGYFYFGILIKRYSEENNR